MRVGIDLNKLLAFEVIEFSLWAYWSLDLPWFGCGILNDDFLAGLSSYHAVKFELLNGLLRLRDAFTHQIYIKRICSFDSALNFESNIIVWHIGMESNIEMQILMWQEISFLWRNSEVFAAESSVPFKLRSHISKVW